MTRKQLVLISFVMLGALVLSGCQMLGLFHREVADTPAATAIPLPTSSPRTAATGTASPPVQTETAEVQVPTGETASPTDVAMTPTPQLVHEPTRVAAPRDDVNLPPGFGISVFARGLKGPRMMTLGPDGEVYVAERGRGRVLRLPDRDADGLADDVEVAADGLDGPSSLDFYQDGSLYVGETTRVLRLVDRDDDGLFQEREVIIEGLPSGGHSTRTVLFSPGWEHLYVSVGSSCNVCIEEDERRATIMRYEPDGSGAVVYAKGLRNAVGITFRPGTSQLWATNNGRDWLGDDQPPETIYVVEQGDDAGWPRCHAGRIVDPEHGEPGACQGVEAPIVEMQAHSAPLGLTFYTGEQFPRAYQDSLFVAFHGSWNRTTPTGYKIVRVPLEGTQPGSTEDFATGWLREDGSKWGRPVDVLTGPDGSLLISDDGEGFIYRVFYTGR